MPPRQTTGAHARWTATGLEKPIFLDERGHRGRIVRIAAAVATLLVTAWLTLVVAGPVGFASLPPLRLPVPVHFRTPRLENRVHLPVAAHHHLHREAQRS